MLLLASPVPDPTRFSSLVWSHDSPVDGRPQCSDLRDSGPDTWRAPAAQSQLCAAFSRFRAGKNYKKVSAGYRTPSRNFSTRMCHRRRTRRLEPTAKKALDVYRMSWM